MMQYIKNSKHKNILKYISKEVSNFFTNVIVHLLIFLIDCPTKEYLLSRLIKIPTWSSVLFPGYLRHCISRRKSFSEAWCGIYPYECTLITNFFLICLRLSLSKGKPHSQFYSVYNLIFPKCIMFINSDL